MALLDLRTVLDTVDHAILPDHLRDWVEISGTILNWRNSNISDRASAVIVSTFYSVLTYLSCGIPHGSVLGMLLFSILMLPRDKII